MIAISPVIIIAAGGDGERIGGGKPLRTLAGRRLLDHAIDWAQTQSDLVALALKDTAQLPPSNLPIRLDRQPGLGPISALDSAFRFGAEAGRAHAMLIGCDQPFLPPDLVAKLASRIGAHGAAMPVSLGRHQPMASLWRIDEAALEQFIAGGGRSLWRFASAVGAVSVEWEASATEDPFANINDLDHLAKAAPRFRNRAP